PRERPALAREARRSRPRRAGPALPGGRAPPDPPPSACAAMWSQALAGPSAPVRRGRRARPRSSGPALSRLPHPGPVAIGAGGQQGSGGGVQAVLGPVQTAYVLRLKQPDRAEQVL